MVKTALRLLLLVMLALDCACSCGADKITVDPNAGLPSVEQIADIDLRVQQKVTCEYWHKPVKTILADLTKQTGVTLNAGYNKQDWQVRDRRMNVFVKDVPLSELMNSIARVMKFRWSRNSDVKPTTYRLIADRKLIGDLQAKASRLAAALTQESAKRRTKLLGELEEIADASPEQIEKLRSENAYLYTCAQTGFAKLFVRMAWEFPGFKEALINANKNIGIPMSSLSSETRALYYQAMGENLRMQYAGSGVEPPAFTEEDLARGTAFVSFPGPPDNPHCVLNDFGMFGCRLPDGRSMAPMSLTNPDSALTKAAFRGITAGGAQWTSEREQAEPELAKELKSATDEQRKEEREYNHFDPIVGHTDEPGLHKKLDLEKRWKELEVTDKATSAALYVGRELKAIALASGFGIVSDSYASVSSTGVFDATAKDKELKDVLDSFGERRFRNWEKHGCVLELRQRDWFRRRASQIPDEWLERWRRMLNATGTLPLDEFAQMVTLDMWQIGENISTDPVLWAACPKDWAMADSQGVLRLYLRLDSNQKRMLFADGLDIGLLRPDQQQCYSEMFDYGYACTWDTDKFSNPGKNRVTMKARVDADSGKQRKWVFTVLVEDDAGGMIDKAFRVPIPNVPVKPAPPAKAQ